jgi:hypothetical protein
MTLVATALCVDRAVEAAPELRIESPGIVRQIAQRLTVSFKTVVPAVRLHQARREEGVASTAGLGGAGYTPSALSRLEISPFQFRLPPPLA